MRIDFRRVILIGLPLTAVSIIAHLLIAGGPKSRASGEKSDVNFIDSEILLVRQVRLHGPARKDVLWKFFTTHPNERVVDVVEVGRSGGAYVLTNLKLYRLNEGGEVEWSYTHNHDGASKVYAAADGTVYVHAYATDPGEFWLLAPPTAWKAGAVFVISSDGRLKWQIKGASARDEGNPMRLAVSPTGEVYIGTYRGEVMAFSPKGELIWKDTKSKCPNIALNPDGSALYGWGQGEDRNFYLCRWNPKTGAVKWRLQRPRHILDMSVGPDIVALLEEEVREMPKRIDKLMEQNEKLKKLIEQIEKGEIDFNQYLNELNKYWLEKRFLVILDKEGKFLFQLQEESRTVGEPSLIEPPLIGRERVYVISQTMDLQAKIMCGSKICALSHQGRVKWSRKFDEANGLQAVLLTDENGEQLYILESIYASVQGESIVHKLYHLREGGKTEPCLTVENSIDLRLIGGQRCIYLVIEDVRTSAVLALQVYR